MTQLLKKIISYFSPKDLIYFIIIGVGIYFAIVYYIALNAKIEEGNIAYKQLSDTLARASTELVTKAQLSDFEKRIGVDIDLIQNDMDHIGAQIKAVGTATAFIQSHSNTNLPSTTATPHDTPPQPITCSLCDLYSYTIQVQGFEIELLPGLTIGRVQFDASSKTPWSISIDKLRIETNTVIGEKSDNTMVFYHETHIKNDVTGQEVKLPITSSEYKEIPKTNRWLWWAPALDISFVNILNISHIQYDYEGMLGVSIMGYGTKDRLIWRFLNIELGYGSEGLAVGISPVKYNLGSNNGLLTNLWIGIDAIWADSWGIGLSIGARL